MKKFLVISFALALSAAPAFAAKWGNLKAPTNTSAKAAYQAISAVEGSYTGAKVVEPTDARGRTKEELHVAEIKEAMHKYMCGFFDESIDLGKTRNLDAALKDLDADNTINEESQQAKVKAALTAMLKDKTLEVYSGSASGNNTMGNVMGVYDTKNDEVVFLGFTNCGSDD